MLVTRIAVYETEKPKQILTILQKMKQVFCKFQLLFSLIRNLFCLLMQKDDRRIPLAASLLST